MHTYTKKEIDFLKRNYKGVHLKELTKRFNEKFNLSVSVSSIQSIKNRYGFISTKKYFFNKNQIEFIKNNYKGITSKELTEKFNDKFNVNLPVDTVKSFKMKNKMLNEINPSHWKKGNPPWNKGKAGIYSEETIEKMSESHKGHIAWHRLPVFSERVNMDGYIEMKIAEPDKWELKHRYLYKQKHGEISQDYNVIFLDGDKRNLDLDNLVLVLKGELMVMNKIGLCNKNPEITKTGLALAKVIMKTRKLKNKGESKC